MLSLRTSLSAMVVKARSWESLPGRDDVPSGACGASDNSVNPGGSASIARVSNAR